MNCLPRRKFYFGPQNKFPLKLFEVVNDGIIIKWSTNGESVIAVQKDFEENVMKYYPGFVQVKTFHNLRRLFRDYGFRFNILRRKKPYGMKIEFRHPLFKRDKPSCVPKICKKKRFRRIIIHPLATSSPKHGRKVIWKRGRTKRAHNMKKQMLLCSDRSINDSSLTTSAGSDDIDSFGFNSDGDFPDTDISSNFSAAGLFYDDCNWMKRRKNFWTSQASDCNKTSITPNPKTSLTEEDSFKLLQIFAKNELSESEYWQLVTRRCGKTCNGKTWDAISAFLDDIVNHELSPLHHKGFYYQLSLDEL